MLYLEELVDAVIAEEGQTLMGLDFLMETLELPMRKIDLIFRKALSEYSERRPMKKTTVINSFEYIGENGETGYITMPEGTTSCRVARYGVLPNQMPRYYMPKFGEQMVEFDPTNLSVRVWPPVTPLRLTYTQKYMPTTNILITKEFTVPYETYDIAFTLDTMYAGKTLKLQKSVPITTEQGEQSAELLEMTPTGKVEEIEEAGEIVKRAELKGTLGRGYVDLRTREVVLDILDDYIAPIMITYYPKYSVVKELDIGHYIFTKLFASKLLEALASLRAQATQEKLHNIDLTTDELYTRVRELKEEINRVLKATISFGDLAPM